MELLEIMRRRRSVRTYTGERIPAEKIEQVLQAGLFSASGRSRRPWEFIVVRERETLDKMARCRDHGAAMLAGADCAIVVVADPAKTDVWTEDCAIAMTNMHLMADHLGLGSCWIQGRLRIAEDGRSTKAFLRELLRFPEDFEVEAILSLGMAAEHPAPHTPEELPLDQVHREQFSRQEDA